MTSLNTPIAPHHPITTVDLSKLDTVTRSLLEEEATKLGKPMNQFVADVILEQAEKIIAANPQIKEGEG